MGWIAAAALAFAGDGVGLLSVTPAEVRIAEIDPVPVPQQLPVQGPWRLVGAVDGVRAYEAPLPVRPRALFFQQPVEGMELQHHGRDMVYGADLGARARAGTWEFTSDSVIVRIRPDSGRPSPGEYTLAWPEAQAREAGLYPHAWPDNHDGYAVRTIQLREVSRSGIFLPAPSTVGWDVEVPADGRLRFSHAVVPPEISLGPKSDGSRLTLTVDGEAVGNWRSRTGRFVQETVSLAKWAGRKVRVRFETDDEDPRRDHVFVAEPAVYASTPTPARVVLLFVDTLRRDHLATYGYGRGASPHLDAWAKSAVVFDDARTVAPWTLPSTRALLTGVEPEHWRDAPTLQGRLSARGWATAAYVGNVYLSSNFDMSLDWGEHACVNWPFAEYETWRAQDFLSRHPDQDALLMVHFMDMHLPYKEPLRYRHVYAGARPDGVDEVFNRNMLMRQASRNRPQVKDYLVDRYDQNLRYLDDTIADFLDALPSDATVVFFADHGEEFFDHGQLEHGHTLYDELLRVPLVVRAPGLEPRRVEGRVSILDVTPTVLELLGTPEPDLRGHSLVTAARGGADPTLVDRVLGFGRPLYNGEAWGVLDGAMKYISTGGRERLFDVAKDAAETRDLAEEGENTRPLWKAMADALERPVDLAFRISPTGRSTQEFSVDVHVPGGVRKAWIGADPTNITSARLENVDAETVRFTFASRLSYHREAFFVPERAPEEIADAITLQFVGEERVFSLKGRPNDGGGAAMVRARHGSKTVSVTWAVLPEPVGEATSGDDDEMKSALQALGYLREDRDPGPEDGSPAP